MSPEFVCLYAQATKQEAIGRIERSRATADTLAWVYVMNLDRRLKGAIALADLLRADPAQTVGDVATFLPPKVTAEADIEEIARLMTDYDLTVVPVVDEREQVMGVVSVDDVDGGPSISCKDASLPAAPRRLRAAPPRLA